MEYSVEHVNVQILAIIFGAIILYEYNHKNILLLLWQLHIILFYSSPLRVPWSLRLQCSFSSLFCFWPLVKLCSLFPTPDLTIRFLILMLFKYYNCSEVVVSLGVPIALTIVLVKCTVHSGLTCTTYCSTRTQCTITKQRMNYTCTNSLLC